MSIPFDPTIYHRSGKPTEIDRGVHGLYSGTRKGGHGNFAKSASNRTLTSNQLVEDSRGLALGEGFEVGSWLRRRLCTGTKIEFQSFRNHNDGLWTSPVLE
jgi:hypothetical protein